MIDEKPVSCPECERRVNVKAIKEGVCKSCYDEYNPDWAEYHRFEQATSG